MIIQEYNPSKEDLLGTSWMAKSWLGRGFLGWPAWQQRGTGFQSPKIRSSANANAFEDQHWLWSKCPKQFPGVEEHCLWKSTRVGADYENVVISKLWILFDLKWRNNWQEKEYASRGFLRDIVCLIVWIFLYVLRAMHKTWVSWEYVAIPNPLDMVHTYKFL